MEREAVIERIKSTARNTDALIAKLDTLTGRISSAKSSSNDELARYYEDQFTEVSIEFMDGVETIIDCWYEMKGMTRPQAEDELLTPETLEEIHNEVVSLLHGVQYVPAEDHAPNEHAAAVHQDAIPAQQLPPRVAPGPSHKVDLTG